MTTYNAQFLEKLQSQFKEKFGRDATSIAYAPGRVEVLGNHTDYNEGYVLSAAIDSGTFCLAAPSQDENIVIYSANFEQQVSLKVDDLKSEYEGGQPVKLKETWCNYIKGVLIKVLEEKNKSGEKITGFHFLFNGDLPLGLGLSSSAALETSAGLCLGHLYQVTFSKEQLAKIGQWSEHNYAGVKCGLLDQISSIYGKSNHLVKTDFRTLQVENVPLDSSLCFLICNTGSTHALGGVDSEYNERRTSCEGAAKHLNDHVTDRDVTHLRDVNYEHLELHAEKLDQKNPNFIKRAKHVVGENERVLAGQKLLEQKKYEEFGKLLYASHDSSINNFENSCKELDQVVDLAKNTPHVLGARLSGGGFGGAALLLIEVEHKEEVKSSIEAAYAKKHSGEKVEVSVIIPSQGAQLISK